MTDRIEIYQAANKQHAWRRRGRNGRLLAGPVETFKSRAAVSKNINANFFVATNPDELPFEPGDPHVTVYVNEEPVEIHGPTAPRRPRSHTEHAKPRGVFAKKPGGGYEFKRVNPNRLK